MEELEVAYNLDDNYIDAIFNIGMLYIAMKEYKKAIRTLEKLHSLQPDNVENIIDMANCCLKIDDLDNAGKWINEILIKNPKNETADKLQKVLIVKRRIVENNR
jgi:tetratricopeptide (TPR) repeat protein